MVGRREKLLCNLLVSVLVENMDVVFGSNGEDVTYHSKTFAPVVSRCLIESSTLTHPQHTLAHADRYSRKLQQVPNMITQTGNYSHSLLFGFKNIFLEQTNVCWVGEFVLELKDEGL